MARKQVGAVLVYMMGKGIKKAVELHPARSPATQWFFSSVAGGDGREMLPLSVADPAASRALQRSWNPVPSSGQVIIIRADIRTRRDLPFRKHFWSHPWGQGLQSAPLSIQGGIRWDLCLLADTHPPGLLTWAFPNQAGTAGSRIPQQRAFWPDAVTVFLDPILQYFLAFCHFRVPNPNLSGQEGTSFSKAPFSVGMENKGFISVKLISQCPLDLHSGISHLSLLTSR